MFLRRALSEECRKDLGNKDENLSEQQVYILPYTSPDNPQTLLINKINTFCSSPFSKAREIGKKHVKLQHRGINETTSSYLVIISIIKET